MFYKEMITFLVILFLGAGCSPVPQTESEEPETLGDDLEFLRQYTDVVVLRDESGERQVLVAPAWQGRVMTSTNSGLQGPSFGWIHYEFIASQELQPHINVFGGEDRFWMGPEGGQFSIFFEKGDPLEFEHWQVPACMDTEPFEIVSQSNTEVSFRHNTQLHNYSDTLFDVQIDRKVSLLDDTRIADALGMIVPVQIEGVAFESENRLTNSGNVEWKKETGLLSIWSLGMYLPSLSTTVVIPFRKGPAEELGIIVNDQYFGDVPSERLKVAEEVLYFKADGRHRSKIGLTPQRARPFLGSYDASRNLLTVVQYNRPEDAIDYVNSTWVIQEKPYGGDVVNSYNDGPLEPGGKSLGPFYELETSSPAAALKPGESILHIHRTFHFTGAEAALDDIARRILGVGIEEIVGSLN